jgi:hypothetical protein
MTTRIDQTIDRTALAAFWMLMIIGGGFVVVALVGSVVADVPWAKLFETSACNETVTVPVRLIQHERI